MVTSSMLCHAMMLSFPSNAMVKRLYDAMIASLLSNGDIFHDAVHSDTNLDPTILNLFHWNDDILNLQEKSQDWNLKKSKSGNVGQLTMRQVYTWTESTSSTTKKGPAWPGC